LHVATYSGWYRFEQRDEQWTQVEKALTFWETDWAAIRSSPTPRHVYAATEHSGLFRQRQRGRRMEAGKAQCAALDDRFFAGTSGAILAGTVPPRLYSAATAGNGGELEGVRLGAR